MLRPCHTDDLVSFSFFGCVKFHDIRSFWSKYFGQLTGYCNVSHAWISFNRHNSAHWIRYDWPSGACIGMIGRQWHAEWALGRKVWPSLLTNFLWHLISFRVSLGGLCIVTIPTIIRFEVKTSISALSIFKIGKKLQLNSITVTDTSVYNICSVQVWILYLL